MQTNIELAGANGRTIGLPLPARRERQDVALERRQRPASLFMLVKEVKRAERLETMVWVGIAIAAVALLVMSFVNRGSPPANERGSKRQRTAALQDAVATVCAPLLPRGLGVRLSSAAFVASDRTHCAVPWPDAAR